MKQTYLQITLEKYEELEVLRHRNKILEANIAELKKVNEDLKNAIKYNENYIIEKYISKIVDF